MLTYDQISPERRTIGDATGRLDDHSAVLGVAAIFPPVGSLMSGMRPVSLRHE